MKHGLIVTSLAAALAASAVASTAFADPPGWDRDHNNGYYVGNHWHQGTPAPGMMRRHDYRAGWRDWRRGQRLPDYYRGHYLVVDDWRGRNLAPPRHGYHYVRDDAGNILLVAVATGLIASIIATSH
jgi:Ni/Co efflux regulator RcnB